MSRILIYRIRRLNFKPYINNNYLDWYRDGLLHGMTETEGTMSENTVVIYYAMQYGRINLFHLYADIKRMYTVNVMTMVQMMSYFGYYGELKKIINIFSQQLIKSTLYHSENSIKIRLLRLAYEMAFQTKQVDVLLDIKNSLAGMLNKLDIDQYLVILANMEKKYYTTPQIPICSENYDKILKARNHNMSVLKISDL